MLTFTKLDGVYLQRIPDSKLYLTRSIKLGSVEIEKYKEKEWDIKAYPNEINIGTRIKDRSYIKSITEARFISEIPLIGASNIVLVISGVSTKRIIKLANRLSFRTNIEVANYKELNSFNNNFTWYMVICPNHRLRDFYYAIINTPVLIEVGKLYND